MNRLNFWKQNPVKATHRSPWLIPAAVAVLIPFYVLATCVKSNADADADAAFIDWISTNHQDEIHLRIGDTRHTLSYPESFEKAQRLEDRNHAVYVNKRRPGYTDEKGKKDGPYIHIGFIGSNGKPSNKYLQSGPANAESLLRWRCNIKGSGSFTIGYAPVSSSSGLTDTGCDFGNPGSSWRPQSLDSKNTAIARNKHTYTAQADPRTLEEALRGQESIIVLPATNAATLYQARYFGNSLVIDVIDGAVNIKTPSGSPAQVQAGNRYTYTYFSGDQGRSSPGIDPDQEAIELFLDPNKWSSLAPQIKDFGNVVDIPRAPVDRPVPPVDRPTPPG